MWVDGCRALLRSAQGGLFTPEIAYNVEISQVSSAWPYQVAADAEYRRPPWYGADVVAVATPQAAWVTTTPTRGLVEALRGKNVIFHNAVEMLVVLRGLGAPPRGCGLADFEDTMTLAALENEEGSRDLKVLAGARLGLRWDVPKVKELGTDERTQRYCAADAVATARLFDTYRDLAASSVLYREVYKPVIPLFADIDAQGTRIDVPLAQKWQAIAEHQLERLDRILASFAKINWNSRDQVAEYFGSRGYRLPKTEVSGKPSVEGPVLQALKEEGSREARLLLKRREVHTRLTRYLRPLASCGGRMHTIHNPVGAETGRTSSHGFRLPKVPGMEPVSGGMNFQNVPEDLRILFLPPEGKVWVSVDGSQMEVRTLAWLAEHFLSGSEYRDASKPLTHFLLTSKDFYAEVARVYLGRDPTPEERKAFKEVALATQYLATPRTLVRSLKEKGIPVSEAQAEGYIAFFGRMFPTVVRWREQMFAYAREHGYITTPLGRRRHIIVGPGGTLSPEAKKIIVNSPVQGTASDFCLRAMLRIAEAGLYEHILGETHDSIDLWADPEDVIEVAHLAKKAFLQEPLLDQRPYFAVKVSAGPNWGALTELQV
jgi:DNA polymerase-1